MPDALSRGCPHSRSGTLAGRDSGIPRLGWVKLGVAASVVISGAIVAAPGAWASTSGPLTHVVNPMPTTPILVSEDNLKARS